MRKVYAIWRPSPLVRATNLEKALKTPARIYFKDESHSPPGSHKPNTAVPQAYYNKIEGINHLATETGAGQWGSSLAFACTLFDMHCKVFMVKVSYHQKPYRRSMMQLWGASVMPSPSNETNAGRQMLAADPECPGSLGIAISEAVEAAATSDDTKYTLGSVLNHVMLHQSRHRPGSGEAVQAGRGLPRRGDRLRGRRQQLRRPGVPLPSPQARGQGHPLRGLRAALLPLDEPRPVSLRFRRHHQAHAADQDVHAGPQLRAAGHPRRRAALSRHGADGQPGGVARASSRRPPSIRSSASRRPSCSPSTEGIIPAPETSHAIRGAINEAIRCRETGEEKCILFNLSGHGLCDMGSYDRFLSNKLEDYAYPQEKIEKAIAELPKIE